MIYKRFCWVFWGSRLQMCENGAAILRSAETRQMNSKTGSCCEKASSSGFEISAFSLERKKHFSTITFFGEAVIKILVVLVGTLR